MENIKRSTRMTKKQKEHMIRYLETHKIMLDGKVAPRELAKIKEYWIELVNQLNFMPGGKKDVRQWKDALNEVKATARKKARLLYRDHTGTGGGPKTAKDLTDLEERLLALLSKTVITGIPAVQELGFAGNEEGNNLEPGPDEAENDENIEIIILEDVEAVPSTSRADSTPVLNVLHPENVTTNKKAPSRKKSRMETQLGKIATTHEECLKNLAKSNNKLAESNSRLADAVLKTKKHQLKSPVFSLKF